MLFAHDCLLSWSVYSMFLTVSLFTLSFFFFYCFVILIILTKLCEMISAYIVCLLLVSGCLFPFHSGDILCQYVGEFCVSLHPHDCIACCGHSDSLTSTIVNICPVPYHCPVHPWSTIFLSVLLHLTL